MTIALSDRLIIAIRKVLDDIEVNGSVLDVYKSAAQIQLALPDEMVDLEDIVAAMLAGRGNIQVIEFDPPALIVPSPDKDETTETPSLGGLVDISGERQSIS
jgi:hypothetical protein